jgi:isopentenyl diphosphate isomerase/L-lactate dehydrogenase-like FMN-dependent dehydrogenase
MTHVNHHSRRRALRNLLGFIAGSPLLHAQRDIPYTAEHYPNLDDLVNVFEFEPICKARILKSNYDYIAGGVDQEFTMRRNREAFDRILLRPRMLVDTSKMDLSTTLFGTKIASPILTAPCAAHQLAHPDGEMATAKAVAAKNTIMCLSSNSSYPFEKVAEATPNVKWWQLYAREDLNATRDRVERAVGSGYKVVVLTVDAPYNSHRERLLRNRVRSQVPPGAAGGNTSNAPRRRVREGEEAPPPHPYRLEPVLIYKLDWKFYETLRTWAKVPVLIKGILTAEDATLAVKHGADGIVVSNHGGRYLDYSPSSIEVLPEIVEAAGGKYPILIDSGFRRGTDILKALAIGAKAVLIGRPVLWGLGAYGQAGAQRVLDLLETELALAMGLAGKPTIASIDRSLVKFDR